MGKKNKGKNKRIVSVPLFVCFLTSFYDLFHSISHRVFFMVFNSVLLFAKFYPAFLLDSVCWALWMQTALKAF